MGCVNGPEKRGFGPCDVRRAVVAGALVSRRELGRSADGGVRPPRYTGVRQGGAKFVGPAVVGNRGARRDCHADPVRVAGCGHRPLWEPARAGLQRRAGDLGLELCRVGRADRPGRRVAGRAGSGPGDTRHYLGGEQPVVGRRLLRGVAPGRRRRAAGRAQRARLRAPRGRADGAGDRPAGPCHGARLARGSAEPGARTRWPTCRPPPRPRSPP